MPDGAKLLYSEESLEVLGHTSLEALDGKKTAFIAISTPGNPDHGH